MSRVSTSARLGGRNKFGPFKDQQEVKYHEGEQ